MAGANPPAYSSSVAAPSPRLGSSRPGAGFGAIPPSSSTSSLGGGFPSTGSMSGAALTSPTPSGTGGGGGAGARDPPPKPSAPSMEEIRGLVDVGAMTRMLHQTIACERDIDAELELLLAQRGQLEAKLAGLEKNAEVLELVRLDADQMLTNIRSTCQLAELVSGRVRELDLAQYRVNETVVRIEAIVDRTNCIVGAKTALESEDYESAAKCVETFLVLDKEFQGAEAGVQPETVQEQKRQLYESKEKLEGVIRSRFAAAAEAEDQAGVERFARLFAPLGLQDEGLRSLVAYLRRVVGVRARKQFDVLLEAMDANLRAGNVGIGAASALANGDGVGSAAAAAAAAGIAPPDFVDALTCLFREVALSVESSEELLRSIHGEDAVVFAIRELQEECDSRAATIVRKYIDFKRLPKAVKDAAAATKAAAAAAGSVLAPVSVASAVLDGSGTSVPGLNLREVEMCLEDMLLLSRRSEEYSAFMLAKLRQAESSGAQLSPRTTAPFKSGMFSRAVVELMGYYVDLEEYLMTENVSKAIRIDEPVPDSFTTSLVDDCFYILQNCSRRAVSTASVQPVLATISALCSILNNEYREALQRRLKEPNLAARLLQAGAAAAGNVAGVGVNPAAIGGGQRSGADVAAALNNVDVSSEYTLKLKQELEELCAEVFPAPGDRERLKASLNEVGETATALKQMGQTALEQLANSITPRLRVALDAVSAVSYELTEAQYADNEVDDPWVQRLCLLVEQNLTALQPVLTPNNYDSLVALVTDLVVRRVEAVVVQKQFNQLGGLQLDRDVRALVSHFSLLTSRTVRDKFARLTQIATLLNLEKVSEILDYWGENSGPMTWRLTPAEVRRVLGLRIDFKPEAIASLRL